MSHFPHSVFLLLNSFAFIITNKGLLKMDSVALVAQLIKNTVILSTAVELGIRWRELAEKMGKLSSAQIAGYEAPHRGKNGEVGPQVSLTVHTSTASDGCNVGQCFPTPGLWTPLPSTVLDPL